MNTIDLHTHSSASDGTYTPAELVNLACQQNLSVLALTDHDTGAGIDEAQEAAAAIRQNQKKSLLVIPGTELSVAYKNSDVHIIGLFINQHHPAFLEATKEIILRRQHRNEKMTDNLRKIGIPITMDALTGNNHDTVITRAHFARFLVKEHIVSTPNEAFRKYLDTSTPYYVPRKYISPAKGIELIKEAGGLPILAHPLHYKLSAPELDSLVNNLSKNGLVGIEVYYANHTKRDENHAKVLARKYHLLHSGGSDFHGGNKPDITLGSGRGNLSVPLSCLEKLAEAADYPLK